MLTHAPSAHIPLLRRVNKRPFFSYRAVDFRRPHVSEDRHFHGVGTPRPLHHVCVCVWLGSCRAGSVQPRQSPRKTHPGGSSSRGGWRGGRRWVRGRGGGGGGRRIEEGRLSPLLGVGVPGLVPGVTSQWHTRDGAAMHTASRGNRDSGERSAGGGEGRRRGRVVCWGRAIEDCCRGGLAV